MHMRTTVIIDEDLLTQAKELTGISEKTAVLHEGLRALIARESARRLTALFGTMPDAAAPPRRRGVRRAAAPVGRRGGAGRGR